MSEKKFSELLKDSRIWFSSKESKVPSLKLFLSKIKMASFQ